MLPSDAEDAVFDLSGVDALQDSQDSVASPSAPPLTETSQLAARPAHLRPADGARSLWPR
ncbi:hypothetical protein ACFWP5_48440, partial [Streptomyces sp. NPDC058469]|uniref:hypothetical protein n=1 Tax=Streptomyces sp. NPDC058469 TaxID=3346514 RepID=UPI00366740D3